MNIEDFEFSDDISEHANLPKVLKNSPNLLKQKTSDLKYNKIINKNEIKQQNVINNKILVNNNLKLSVRIGDHHINNKNNFLIQSEKNENFTPKNNILTKSQRIGFNYKLNNKILIKTEKLKHVKGKNKSGTNIVNLQDNLNNKEIITDLKKSYQQNSKNLNKKIIVIKDQMINAKINNKGNSLDSKKNNNKNQMFKKININDLKKKEKNGVINSHGDNLISKKNKNLSKNEDNKLFKKIEGKSILDLNGQELSKFYIRRSNKKLRTQINSIRCFCSNSSQILFNKEKLIISNNQDISLKKDNLHFQKEKQNSRITIETEINRKDGNKIKKNHNSKVNSDSNCKTYEPNYHREKKIFIKKSKTNQITIKKINLLIKDVNSKSQQILKPEKEEKLQNSNIKEKKDLILYENKNNNHREEGIRNNSNINKEEDHGNQIGYLKEKNNNKKDENLELIEQNIDFDFFSSKRLTLPPEKNNKINNNEEEYNDNNKENKEEINIIKNKKEICSNKENSVLINKFKKENGINQKEEIEEIYILKSTKNISNDKLEFNNTNKNEKIINHNINENFQNSKKKKNVNEYKCHYALSKAGKDELGNSKTNQDTYIVLAGINGLKDFNIFGVLDGHGPDGHYVSQFISKYIKEHFQSNPLFDKMKNTEKIYKQLSSRNFQLIKNIFINADNALKDEDFDSDNSGTTCVLVIHIGQHLICANTGDSRAILIFDEKNDNNLNFIKVFPLSFDSKPENPEEKLRINNMGGTIQQMKNKYGKRIGPYRIWVKNKDYPGLAMSRSLGDFCAKDIGVIPDPEIIECNLSIYSKYIVICSDGVWEFLNNEDVMNIGKKFYLENNPNEFCQKLFDKSTKFWQTEDDVIDDITIVTVFF